MATAQFTYEQVKDGFNGLIDYDQNPLRVYGASRAGKWSGKITGTEAKMLGKDSSNLFLVSVDSGAYVSSSNSSGVHTLFTGLSDTEHDITIAIGGPFGYTLGYWDINQSYLLEVTGATPSFSVLEYSWSAHSAELVSSGVTIPINPTTYTPEFQRSIQAYDSSATSKVMFSTAATELLITLNQLAASASSLYYNIDGGAPIVIAATPGNIFRITGLSGTHTYNIRAGDANGAQGRDSDIWSVMSDAPLIKIGSRLDQFGDSITYGVGLTGNPIIDIHNAAAYFGRLGQTYATSGWTVNDLLTNLSTFNLTNLVEVGDIAIMAIGRNSLTINTDPAIQADYASTITALLAAGYSKVFCRGILSESSNTYSAQNAAIELIVSDYASSNVSFVDVSSWVAIDTQDGTHPSQTGYAQMVEYAKVTYSLYLNPPTSNAGPDISDIAASIVVPITGTATAGTGTIASTVWEQTTGAVQLVVTGSETLSLSATTPALAQTTTFKLTVTNSNGISSFDTMTLQNLAFITPDSYSINFAGRKDTVIKGYKNTVIFTFDFAISNYIDVSLTLGNEVYSTLTTPLNLYIKDNNNLVLDIGTDTAILESEVIPLIVGDQIMLNGECKKVLLNQLYICEANV
jgi:lysophospholipase L1-like esterase